MVKRLRLISGLILFAFLTCHLANLAFGLHSLTALDDARGWILWFWNTLPGKVLLMGAFMTHLTLGLLALYKRNTLRMNRHDAVQLALGLLIFPLLFGHILANGMAPMMTGARQTYFSILTLFWVLDSVTGLQQVIVTVITWIHGCMGLFIWMRIQPWWPRVAGFAYPFVIAIPLLALLGMVEAGKEVIELNKNPIFANVALGMLNPVEGLMQTIISIKNIGLSIYAAVLAGVLIARYLRVKAVLSPLYITYADGTVLDVKAGLTLLEISRMNDIPHASLCGGKGRCGTCKVRIISGIEALPIATEIEQKTLDKIDASPDTRLACQVIPRGGAITIERLMPAYIEPKDLRKPEAIEPIAALPGGSE